MSQMGGPGYRPTAKSNIYTVLVAIAFLALVGGIISVWLRGKELYGTSNPFDMKVEIKEPPKVRPVTPSTDTTAPSAGTSATPPASGTGGTTPPTAPGTGAPTTPPVPPSGN
jgi:hypothetical protein